jgi:hypothetical protein
LQREVNLGMAEHQSLLRAAMPVRPRQPLLSVATGCSTPEKSATMATGYRATDVMNTAGMDRNDFKPAETND